MNQFNALLIIVALSACKPSETIVPADYVEIAPPEHQKIALYINQYKLGPHQGAALRPNLSNWKPQVKQKFSATTNQEGQPPYSATLEYLGHKPDADIYSVTITHPASGGTTTFTKEIRFSGSDIEIFRDDHYRIGLRPDPTNEG